MKNSTNVTFSVLKATEGGPGYSAMLSLKEKNIPCKKAPTPYVGHVGISIPKRFSKKAEKILF